MGYEINYSFNKKEGEGGVWKDWLQELFNWGNPINILTVSATLWIQYSYIESLKKWVEKELN